LGARDQRAAWKNLARNIVSTYDIANLRTLRKSILNEHFEALQGYHLSIHGKFIFHFSEASSKDRFPTWLSGLRIAEHFGHPENTFSRKLGIES
jgi:hypothetical protein